MTKATEARQQPAHGQRRGRFHAQDVVLAAQRITGALQCREAFTHARQQQPRRFAQLQAAAIAHEQTAGEMLFQRADMTADCALGDR
ncbi:hypothetical protein D3C84_510540 [compost metagenome]